MEKKDYKKDNLFMNRLQIVISFFYVLASQIYNHTPKNEYNHSF